MKRSRRRRRRSAASTRSRTGTGAAETGISYAALAAQTGVTVEEARRSVAELAALGYVEVLAEDADGARVRIIGDAEFAAKVVRRMAPADVERRWGAYGRELLAMAERGAEP